MSKPTGEKMRYGDLDLLREHRASIMDSTSLSYDALTREQLVNMLKRVIDVAELASQRQPHPMAGEVEVSDAMVSAYLKAQAQYVLDRDRRMVEGDPQKACKCGLQAALSQLKREGGR